MSSHRQNKAADLYRNLNREIIKLGGVECEELPYAFFPEDSVWPSERRLMVAAAKAVCNRCPLQDMCADYGIMTNEDWGIWGGLTPEDRKQLRRK
jgi:WhiB family redox-sensing transcriptional regulator